METLLRLPTNLDDETLPRGVARFKALADPTRLSILSLLASRPGPICVCEINRILRPGAADNLASPEGAARCRADRLGAPRQLGLLPLAARCRGVGARDAGRVASLGYALFTLLYR